MSTSALLLLNSVLLMAALMLLIPVATLFIECIAAVLFRKSTAKTHTGHRPTVAVLVPAHNEELVLANTLQTLIPQLTEPDRLIVIADNCDDNTASVAREMGAIAIARQDLQRRGKGFALDFGVKYLANQPPDVVVIVDADCIVAPGSIESIARLSRDRHRPVQATYLFESPANPSPKATVSLLAILVKNLVRLTGMKQLGLPCLLTGTGMAFPWSIIQSAPLASDNIVEDMNLGLDLAIAGYPPLFCPEARVTSVLPTKDQAAKSQRTRWEHGHLQTIKTQVPRLLKVAIGKRRLDLFGLALDLLVPPLSLLVMLWLVMAIAAFLGLWLGASPVPAALLAIEGSLILVAILLAWAKFGRADLPAKSLLAIPLYILWKIPLYFAFLLKPQKKWVRTERDTSS